MTTGAIYQRCLKAVVGLELPKAVHRDVVAALNAARNGPIDYLYSAGTEAGVRGHQLGQRLEAIFYNFALFNLSDDLSDGDCDYLRNASATGPCVQLILQNLFAQSFSRLRMPSRARTKIFRDLLSCEVSQHVELTTVRWTYSRYLSVADGIAGKQWAVYLRILWYDRRAVSRVDAIAKCVGRTALIAGDRASGDKRFSKLSALEQKRALTTARTAARRLRRERRRFAQQLVSEFGPRLA